MSGIRGVDSLMRTMNSRSQGLRREVVLSALAAGAMVLEGEMKLRIRDNDDVDTGNLMNAFGQQPTSDHSLALVVMAEYGAYHEYGTGIYAEGGKGRKTPWVYFNERAGHYVTTKGMPAKPFARPAVDAKRGAAARAVARALARKLR